MGNLKLTSSTFSDGGEIPRKFGYKNGNASPPLTISGIPKGTESLALIMDDPDAMGAVGKGWVHWVLCNFNPTITEIAEDFRRQTYKILMGKKDIGITEGITDFNEFGYGGPAPPDKRHTYVFKLYALDSKLDLPDGSTKADVEKAMEGHILEETTLKGTYAPDR